jgi:hypothetical protein
MNFKNILVLILLTPMVLLACQNSDSKDDTADDLPTAVEPQNNPNPNRALPRGNWGAPEIGIKINRSDVDVSTPCGAGWFDGQIRPDENGNFQNDGSIARHLNAEAPSGWRTAVYTGTVNAEQTTMSLKISYTDDAGEPLEENYVLGKNSQGPAEGAVCELNNAAEEEGGGAGEGTGP